MLVPNYTEKNYTKIDIRTFVCWRCDRH